MTIEDELRPHLEHVAAILGIGFHQFHPAEAGRVAFSFHTLHGEKFCNCVAPMTANEIKMWVQDVGAVLRVTLFDWRAK